MKIQQLAGLTTLFAISACGGSGDSVTLLNGAGATFPNPIYQQWILSYNQSHPDVEINYQSIGSGGGVRQFSDGTVDFGGSDAPMTDEEIAAIDGNVMHIPTVLGAVAPTYNVPGISQSIRFTPDVLADIFLGNLTTWNDPRIRSINPGVTLPAQEIVVVHRSDGSGTTFIWTEYLTKVSEAWANGVGTGKSVAWPVGLGGRGNEGVTATVQQTPGAIGYVALEYALATNLPVGMVRNQSGQFVMPSIESVTAAAAGAMETMGPDTDFRVSLTNPPGEAAYPISSFTWLLLRRSYDDATKAEKLADYVWWAVTEGSASAADQGYAPLPEQLAPWIADRLESITVDGSTVWSRPS